MQHHEPSLYVAFGLFPTGENINWRHTTISSAAINIGYVNKPAFTSSNLSDLSLNGGQVLKTFAHREKTLKIPRKSVYLWKHSALSIKKTVFQCKGPNCQPKLLLGSISCFGSVQPRFLFE